MPTEVQFYAAGQRRIFSSHEDALEWLEKELEARHPGDWEDVYQDGQYARKGAPGSPPLLARVTRQIERLPKEMGETVGMDQGQGEDAQ